MNFPIPEYYIWNMKLATAKLWTKHESSQGEIGKMNMQKFQNKPSNRQQAI